ncbi:MAG: hypothetical protein QOG58_4433, partial [Caballeronia sp.]|nr:hypothetical protein [Caballeronia sp.]
MCQNLPESRLQLIEGPLALLYAPGAIPSNEQINDALLQRTVVSGDV